MTQEQNQNDKLSLRKRIDIEMKRYGECYPNGRKSAWGGNILLKEHLDKMSSGQSDKAFTPVVWPVQDKNIPSDNGSVNYGAEIVLFTDAEQANFFAYSVSSLVEIIQALVERLGKAEECLETIQRYTLSDYKKPIPPHIANDLIMIERLAEQTLEAISLEGKE